MNKLLQSENATNKFWKVALGLLLAVYLCNFFAPLRLTDENISFFLELDNASGGGTPRFMLYQPPYGYLWLLQTLADAGLLHNYLIIITQFLLLVGSIFFLRKLFTSQAFPVWIIVLLLLNWTTISAVVTPLPEMQYLFLSSGALYYCASFNKEKKLWQLFLTILLGALAAYTLLTGLLLLLALVFSLLYTAYGKTWNNLKWEKPNIIIIAILLLALVIFLIISSAGWTFFANLFLHPQELSELSLNMPIKMFLSRDEPWFIFFMYSILGLTALIFFFQTFLSRNIKMPVVVRVYLILYFLGTFFIQEPGYDTVDWLPIFPLLLWSTWMRVKQLMNSAIQKWICRVILTVYIVGGFGFLCYNTWLSFDRKALSQQQGWGRWEEEYKTHFLGTYKINGSFKDPGYYLDKYDAAHRGIGW